MNLPIKQLQEIATEEMTRKEFLQFIGASILGIFGVWGILHNLQSVQHKTLTKKSTGYGSTPYGG